MLALSRTVLAVLHFATLQERQGFLRCIKSSLVKSRNHPYKADIQTSLRLISAGTAYYRKLKRCVIGNGRQARQLRSTAGSTRPTCHVMATRPPT